MVPVDRNPLSSYSGLIAHFALYLYHNYVAIHFFYNGVITLFQDCYDRRLRRFGDFSYHGTLTNQHLQFIWGLGGTFSIS